MRVAIALILAMSFIGGETRSANAQVSQFSFDNGRRCHTIRTCQFARGGSYRGCLSSYNCRRCQLVRARCQIGNRRGTCRRMRCYWGS